MSSFPEDSGKPDSGFSFLVLHYYLFRGGEKLKNVQFTPASPTPAQVRKTFPVRPRTPQLGIASYPLPTYSGWESKILTP